MFTYYRYLDKFHVEPKDWNNLFEYANYVDVDGKIHKVVSDLKEK